MKIAETGVICLDLEGNAEKVVAPRFQRIHDGEQLLFSRRVVAFGGGQLARVVGPCTHPAEEQDGVTGACSAGFTWLGCPEPGYEANPPCTRCAETANAQFDARSTRAAECASTCNAHFLPTPAENTSDYSLLNAAGNTSASGVCLPCADALRRCPVAWYRTTCVRGAATVPACTECADKKGLCDAGQFRQPCAGDGYSGALSSDKNWNHCVGCRPEQECPNKMQWKACDPRLPYDSSRCVNCSDTNPAHSTPTDTAACGFVCDAGWYRGEATDVSRSATCLQCKVGLHQICGRTNVDGCASEGCDAQGAVGDAQCVCLPGFGWVRDANDDGQQSRCRPCPPSSYSAGGTRGCTACPFGYNGNLPLASTACWPCAVNTFRGLTKDSYRDRNDGLPMSDCTSCLSGTAGVLGSSVCKPCVPDSGYLAIETLVPRYIFNYAALDGVSPWQEWDTTAPTHCGVPGGDTATMQICKDGDYNTIQVKENAGDDAVLRVGHAIAPEFECGVCDNGLAYSATWGIDELFENPREEAEV